MKVLKLTQLKSIVVMTIVLTAMQVKSQIVYTDIDPDTTIYVPNVYEDSIVSFSFDLNNDGYLDFGIKAHKINYQNNIGKDIYIIPKGTTIHRVVGHCDGFGATYYYTGDTISSILPWGIYGKYLTIQNTLPWKCIPPASDLYWGLQLNDSTGTYYGWVRVYCTENYITIKDYAYNTLPNQQIIAGQTSTGLENSKIISNIVSINTTNKKIIVNINENNTQTAEIFITNSLGQQIVNSTITSNYYESDLLISGIYFVKVQLQNQVKSKKIIIA